MADLIINGPTNLNGKVRVSGAKNAATRLMAATLLTNEKVVLSNFPTELIDVRYSGNFLEALGSKVSYDKKRNLFSARISSINSEVLDDYCFPIRTTYLFVAGQILRNGLARIPYPGGCKLGGRKHDLHIMVWEKLGCNVEEKERYIEIRAIDGKFCGSDISFPISTVGGTENALLCASVAVGRTNIYNAYITPEIYNLIEMLQLMGAEIKTIGNSTIEVVGKEILRGATIKVIPDRIEALTWIVLGALSGGRLLIENVPFKDMVIPLKHIEEAGISFFRNENAVYICKECISNNAIQPFEIACGTHPGVISDMQPFFVLLGIMGNGKSLVLDYRYPKRIDFLKELEKFCPPNSLDWSVDSTAKISIRGARKLNCAEANSTDLRGSMVILMAALLAEGKSKIKNADMALRGYNDLLGKLSNIGIDCKLED
jgi:UDP-N-acetylglucosamine 1-carboxyvinyltransferase